MRSWGGNHWPLLKTYAEQFIFLFLASLVSVSLIISTDIAQHQNAWKRCFFCRTFIPT